MDNLTHQTLTYIGSIFSYFLNFKFDFLLGNFARNLLSQNIKKLINLRGNNLIRYAVDGRSPGELIMESLTLHLIRSPQKVIREGKKINSLTCWLESRQNSNLQWNELLDYEIVHLLFDFRNKSMVVGVRGYPRGEGWGGTVTSTAVSNWASSSWQATKR